MASPYPQLLLHTVRHLRPAQVLARLWFHVARPRRVEGTRLERRPEAGRWQEGAARSPSMIGPGRFRLLNREAEVRGAASWNSSESEKLWLYHLHYFDDLNAAGAGERVAWHRDLVSRWIAGNPVGSGNGWEPYPLSRRIVNWIKWGLRGNRMDAAWLESLATQARYLRRRLEYHLLGNHLFSNAKALVFAGAFFDGDEARGWLETGLRIIDHELSEQVLPDGGHFERTPLYHALVLEDLLDLLNLAGVYPETVPDRASSGWGGTAQRMVAWLQAMSHPDGEIALFNDAAFGLAPTPAALNAYARSLGLGAPPEIRQGLTPLYDSGYVRLQSKVAVVLFDAAPVGPDYLPGHAHADTLSFELSLFGQRVVVNGGTSGYGVGAGRSSERGTAAHSTVQIDGEDSSEVWAGFRVARRARPRDLAVDDAGGELVVTCAHDGYRRLPGRPVHRRRLRLGHGGLRVIDGVEGSFGEAVARFHLHPAVTAEGGPERGLLILADGRTIRWKTAGGAARIVSSSWHPEFGLSLDSRCLEIGMRERECALELQWG